MRPGEFRDPQCEQCELAAINPEFLACKHCATGYRQ